jgi:hypothetical protein
MGAGGSITTTNATAGAVAINVNGAAGGGAALRTSPSARAGARWQPTGGSGRPIAGRGNPPERGAGTVSLVTRPQTRGSGRRGRIS